MKASEYYKKEPKETNRPDEIKVLTYDEAMLTTLNDDGYMGQEIIYQNITFFIMTLGLVSMNPIQFGM